MKTGIVKDPRFMEHSMGAFHVETPQRIEVLNRMVEEELSFPYLPIKPRPALEEEIEWVHLPAYFQFIKATAGKQACMLDPDTMTSARTFEVALLAAGGLLKAIELIRQEQISNAFALVRPPGHHAEASQAMGFCFFNNVAVAAEFLIRKSGLKRILVVDWDLHHGNGTEHAFFSRKDVLYFSTHQVPLYPGTGHFRDVGHGEGKGYTVNVPLLAGKGDEDFLYVFQKILRPIADQYKPEFVLVSAGFDISEGDPLGGMHTTSGGFGRLAGELMDIAEAHAGGRLAFTLEGGYNLQDLKEGVKSVLHRLAGEAKGPEPKVPVSGGTKKELAPVIQVLKEYWDL